MLREAEPVAVDGPAVARHRVIDVTLGSTLLTAGREGRTVPVELVEWTIGPVRLVSIPGEAFHALGRAIEDRAGADGTPRAPRRPRARMARIPAVAVP